MIIRKYVTDNNITDKVMITVVILIMMVIITKLLYLTDW